MATVVVVGSASVDEQVIFGHPPRIQLGGVVTYAGAAFARSALSPVAVSNIGGKWTESTRRIMERLGIRLCAGSSDTMTSFRNKVLPNGEREQDLLSIASPIDTELISRALQEVTRPHIHLGSLHGNDINQAALQIVITQAETVTLDVQGFVRNATAGKVRAEVSPLLAHALTSARMVKADRGELELILRTLRQTEAGLLKKYGIEELVVTCGGDGGYVIKDNAEILRFQAVPVEHAYDTTGAGDVFFAVYLAERIYNGKSSQLACQQAASVAAQHVAGHFIDPRILDLN